MVILLFSSFIFICVSLGNLGSRIGYLYRNVCQRADRFLSVLQRKNAASFLQAEIFSGYDKTDCQLRQPELPE